MSSTTEYVSKLESIIVPRMRAKCPTHLILLHIIALILRARRVDEEKKISSLS
jgi:hypothetical protein